MFYASNDAFMGWSSQRFDTSGAADACDSDSRGTRQDLRHWWREKRGRQAEEIEAAVYILMRRREAPNPVRHVIPEALRVLGTYGVLCNFTVE